MSRAKGGVSKGNMLLALVLAGTFLAGSATYLAVKDSISKLPQEEPSEPYLLIPQQTEDPPTGVAQPPEAQPLQETAAPPELPVEEEPANGALLTAVPPTEEPSEQSGGGEDAVPVLASGDAPVKQLYIKPLEGAISKPYSAGELVYSQTLGDYRTHTGVDIAAKVGAKVRAMADGTVTDIYADDLLGSVIEVTHTDGTISRYCNLLEGHAAGIKTGVAVKMGDILSGVGETALSEIAEEAHLHLEVYQKGVSVDPVQLFQ